MPVAASVFITDCFDERSERKPRGQPKIVHRFTPFKKGRGPETAPDLEPSSDCCPGQVVAHIYSFD